MQLIRGPINLRKDQQGCVLTIGAFDGLHLGHQALLARAQARARELSRRSMMLTFEPMPREFLLADAPPPRLTSLRERCRRLESSGLDYLFLLRFFEALRHLSGADFVGRVLGKLRPAGVVIGHDFKFGRNGEANAALLRRAGGEAGFEVEVLDPILVDGVRVSSSAIRAALASHDLQLARRFLGRPYSMIGRVVRGEQLGRKLGFPTANLRVQRMRTPLAGIFAVWVHAVDANPRAAVASLGTRPTVGGTEVLLEAHLFDFEGDLYGREIEVEFVEWLRDEEKFESLDAMVEQMRRDAERARHILKV
jgi:riboflavin kinase / FMN adenylyltransferase